MIPSSIACGFQFQLNVNAPPDALLYPSTKISVDVINNLVMFGEGHPCSRSHILHATMQVNSEEERRLRGEHE